MDICAAPSCPNPKCYPSQHCEVHSGFFINLYKKYKVIENTLKDVIDSDYLPNNIPELLKIYDKLQKVYDLRKEFREKAFKKERWDSGHEVRLNIIVDKMYTIQNKLEEIFNAKSVITNVPSKEEQEEENTELEENIEVIRENNLKAVEELRGWNETIPLLIQENSKTVKIVDNYITLMYNNVYKAFAKITTQEFINTHTDAQIETFVEWITLFVYKLLDIVGSDGGQVELVPDTTSWYTYSSRGIRNEMIYMKNSIVKYPKAGLFVNQAIKFLLSTIEDDTAFFLVQALYNMGMDKDNKFFTRKLKIISIYTYKNNYKIGKIAIKANDRYFGIKYDVNIIGVRDMTYKYDEFLPIEFSPKYRVYLNRV